MKLIRLSTFAIFISLSLAFSSGASGKEKDSDDADSEDEVSIEKVTLARDAGEKFEPVTNFKTSDTFCVLVKLSEPRTGTRVKAVWTAVEAGGLENKEIFEKEWGIYSLRGKQSGNAVAATAGNFLRAVPLAAIVSIILSRGRTSIAQESAMPCSPERSLPEPVT